MRFPCFLQYLIDLKQQFPNAQTQAQIDVLNARVHYLKDEHKKAKQLLEQLEDEPVIRSVDSTLDKAKALHEVGLNHKAQELFSQVIAHCERHNSSADPITMHYLYQQQQEKKEQKAGEGRGGRGRRRGGGGRRRGQEKEKLNR